jgi:hypothetical protein
MSPRPRRSERVGLAAFTLLTACALGASCRQTVMLDTDAGGAAGVAGAAGTTGPPPEPDASGSGNRNGGGGLFGGGNHFDGGHPELPTCQLQALDLDPRAPFVILSVDRSSDMQTWFGAGTKLDAIQQQVEGLVSKYRFVKFGYQEFPAPMGMCSTQGCCAGDVTLPSLNNASTRAIRQAIHVCDGGGPSCNQPERPIADALSKCFATYKRVFTPGDLGHRYVVLFTSGDPTCQSDPMSMSAPCDDAVAQVTKLNNTGTNTHVFGVGDGSSSPCLNNLALYSGLGMPPHIVTTPGELSSTLDEVIDTIASEGCKLDVHTPVADPKTVTLFFDGMQVPIDPVNGWSVFQGTPLVLAINGTYCRQLEQSVNQIQAFAGCTFPHN